MKHFWIAMDDGTKKEVFGEPIKIGEWDCFIYTREEKMPTLIPLYTITETWHCISEKNSGMNIMSTWFNKELAIELSESLLSSHDLQTIIKHCKGQLQFHGLNYPLNA